MNSCKACDKWGKVYEAQTKRIAYLESTRVSDELLSKIFDNMYSETVYGEVQAIITKRKEQDDD